MQQVVDWIFDNAFAIVGGSILFIGILALFVFAEKGERQRNAKASEDKDPREGE